MNQSSLPVIIVPGGQVLGQVPLPSVVDFTPETTSVVVGSTTHNLHWHVVPQRGKSPEIQLAVIALSPMQARRNQFPDGFARNPDEYSRPTFSERSIIFNRQPLPMFWYAFVTGYHLDANPVGGPHTNGSDVEVLRWSVDADFSVDSDCAYIDLDWPSLGDESKQPVSIQINSASVPSFLHTLFVSNGIVPMQNANQADVSPTLRLFRMEAPVAGDYIIEATIFNSDGSSTLVQLELSVP